MTDKKRCCRTCGYKKAYRCGLGTRLYCYCEHPRAEESFEKSGGSGEACFISFAVKYSTVPAIKTSPRWCPLRRGDPDV